MMANSLCRSWLKWRCAPHGVVRMGYFNGTVDYCLRSSERL
jgi:hypothetical protein